MSHESSRDKVEKGCNVIGIAEIIVATFPQRFGKVTFFLVCATVALPKTLPDMFFFWDVTVGITTRQVRPDRF